MHISKTIRHMDMHDNIFNTFNYTQTYQNTRFTRQGGNKLLLVVERGEMIVPSLNSAFPKPKEEAVEKPKSYSQEVQLQN